MRGNRSRRGLRSHRRASLAFALTGLGLVVLAGLGLETSAAAFGPQAPPPKKAAVGPAPPSAGAADAAPAQQERPREERKIETVPLLGKGANWRLNDWRAETDDTRGGVSTAQLKGLVEAGTEFSGSLDPSVLGSAFAGISLQEKVLPTPLSECRGLVIDLLEADGKEYAVALRVNGAPAGIQHQFRFRAEKPGSQTMFFKDFRPVLRGKPAPEPQLLDLQQVESIMLLIMTDFGDGQAGPFALVLGSVQGILGKELPPPPPPARETKWTCNACSTMNFDIAKTCTRCGEGRMAEKEKAAVAKAMEEKAKPVKWPCSGCGRMNFPGAEECAKCGGRRG